MFWRPLSLVTAMIVVANSFPSSDHFEKRLCGTILQPSRLHLLKEAQPNQAFPNTVVGNTGAFLVSQTQVAGNIVDQLAYFTGPTQPAYGCQLGISFPRNYVFNPYNGNQLNVYTVRTPIPARPTYNNIMKEPFLFGTITIVAGQTAIINSHACPTRAQGGLAYVFSFPEWVTKTASIGWNQGGNPTIGLTGTYLSYNC